MVRTIRNTILKLCAELWNNQSWILHHDTASAQTLMLGREFLAKKKTVIMFRPPNSPDLVPSNFFLLPKLKTLMKGKCFVTIEVIKEKSKQELFAIPKSAYQKCFEVRKKRWHKCIISEGDKIDSY